MGGLGLQPRPRRVGSALDLRPADRSAAAPVAFLRVITSVHDNEGSALPRWWAGRRSPTAWETVLESWPCRGGGRAAAASSRSCRPRAHPLEPRSCPIIVPGPQRAPVFAQANVARWVITAPRVPPPARLLGVARSPSSRASSPARPRSRRPRRGRCHGGDLRADPIQPPCSLPSHAPAYDVIHFGPCRIQSRHRRWSNPGSSSPTARSSTRTRSWVSNRCPGRRSSS